MRTRESVRSLSLTPIDDQPVQGAHLRFPDATGTVDAAANARFVVSSPNDDNPTEHRLVFPRAAVDVMMACKRSCNQPRGIVHEIERTLDTMQRKLDGLKDDVHNFRFPTYDGPPPVAA